MLPSSDIWKPIFRNALSAFRHRYAGSGVGVFWNLIHPLIQVVVFGGVAWVIRGSSGGTLGGLVLCCALLPWLSFSEAVLQSSQAILRNSGFMRTMSISAAVFVAESALVSLLGMFVTLGLLIVAVISVQGTVRPEIALACVAVVLLHAFAFGLALALSAMTVLLPDVSEMLRSVLHLWMWTMPIVYSKGRTPSAWAWTFDFNPPWIFIRSIRDLLVGGAPVSLGEWAGMVGCAALAIGLGLTVQRRLDSSVRDLL